MVFGLKNIQEKVFCQKAIGNKQPKIEGCEKMGVWPLIFRDGKILENLQGCGRWWEQQILS